MSNIVRNVFVGLSCPQGKKKAVEAATACVTKSMVVTDALNSIMQGGPSSSEKIVDTTYHICAA